MLADVLIQAGLITLYFIAGYAMVDHFLSEGGEE